MRGGVRGFDLGRGFTTASESTGTALIPKARGTQVDTRPTRVLVPFPEPARVRRRELTGGEGLLAGLLTTLVIVILTVNISGFPMASDDEGTYLAQAWAVATGKGLAHYTYWYDHPPLAWIQLAALSWIPDLFGVTGPAVTAGRVAMIPVVAVCLLLCGLVTRPGGVALGWVLQAVLIASGFVVPSMFVLGAAFAALWWASVHYGRKIDEAKARFAAQADASTPDAA